MKTILVTGANGQLGNEMRIVSKQSQDCYIFTDVNEVEGVETTYLDITDLHAIRKMVADNNVDVIVNCAAYTNVDKAEEDVALCTILNAEAPDNLAIAMKEVNGLLIHISTDYVFGGDPYNTPCKEDQQGTPTGAYGMSKLLGEQAIQSHGGNYVIIRTAWLYSEFGNNFLKKMLQLTSKNEALKVVFDQVGTPTYAGDLALAIFSIIDGDMYEGREGVYHFSNEGVCSWFDFATEIATATRHACRIIPCHSSEFPSRVKRPSYSVLDKTKFRKTFGIEIPHWRESMLYCLKRMGVLKTE